MSSFLDNLPCSDPASFTCMQPKKMPDEAKTPVAHNVPLSTEEKTIQLDRTPYFLRLLQAQAGRNATENRESAKKGKRRHEDEESEEVPVARTRKLRGSDE